MKRLLILLMVILAMQIAFQFEKKQNDNPRKMFNLPLNQSKTLPSGAASLPGVAQDTLDIMIKN